MYRSEKGVVVEKKQLQKDIYGCILARSLNDELNSGKFVEGYLL
jgi:hypothetical protein